MENEEISDLPGLLDFYRLVIRETADIAVHARWEFGKHPTEAMISDYYCFEGKGRYFFFQL